jgi:hypothetical protein
MIDTRDAVCWSLVAACALACAPALVVWDWWRGTDAD